MIAVVRSRSRTKLFVLFVLLLILAVVAPISYLGWRQSVSGVHVVGTVPRLIGHKAQLTLTLEATRGNIVWVEVRVLQGGKSTVVTKQDSPLGHRAEIPVTIESAPLGLREGSATLDVWARDDF